MRVRTRSKLVLMMDDMKWGRNAWYSENSRNTSGSTKRHVGFNWQTSSENTKHPGLMMTHTVNTQWQYRVRRRQDIKHNKTRHKSSKSTSLKNSSSRYSAGARANRDGGFISIILYWAQNDPVASPYKYNTNNVYWKFLKTEWYSYYLPPKRTVNMLLSANVDCTWYKSCNLY